MLGAGSSFDFTYLIFTPLGHTGWDLTAKVVLFKG